MTLFSSRSRIIMTIGDDGIVVVPCGIPRALPFFVPTDGPMALTEIFDFLAENPLARVTLLADNLAQDYRSDDVPRLNAFDRAKLISRRLKQTFPAARLTTHLRFKKSFVRVMMIGLHESNPVFAWADRLRARLPDIALLPVEGVQILATLMPEASNGWAMLISRQKSGGFRQIVTFKNDLIFTRLTPLPEANDDDDEAEIIARDIKASLDYLSRQGLHNSQDLSVLLLMPDDIHQRRFFENLSLESIRSIAPTEAAQTLALPFAPECDDKNADILFAAHLLTRFRPTLSLMLPDTKKIWLTQTIRRWGMRAACTALLAVIASTVWSAGDFAATLYHSQKEAAELNETQQLLAQAQANAAPMTEPLGRMRQALALRHIYERLAPTPWQGLNELAGELDHDSQIVKLEWKKDSDAAPEAFTISLRETGGASVGDRAETVAAFTRETQNIARAMPEFSVDVVKPPYPSLPQESVTATTNSAEEPLGEISLQRKAP